MIAHRKGERMQLSPSQDKHGRQQPQTNASDRRRFLASAILVAGSLGCSSMTSVDPLEVTLTQLNVTDVTVFETTLVARLRITNPNPEPFSINGASFKLILEDKKVGTGTTSEVFTVARLDSALVDVVFHIDNASALLRLRNVLENKEVSYGIQGSLFTQGAFGTKKLKVDKTGHVDLKGTVPSEIDGPDNLSSPPSG
jgi:LEA14-like dessication related protein